MVMNCSAPPQDHLSVSSRQLLIQYSSNGVIYADKSKLMKQFHVVYFCCV